MYAHKVIEDVIKFEKKLKGDDKEMVGLVKKTIENAEMFNIGNVSDYKTVCKKILNEESLFWGDYGEIRLPYAWVWVDFSNDDGSKCGAVLLADNSDTKSDEFDIFPFKRLKGSNSWQMAPFHYDVGINKELDTSTTKNKNIRAYPLQRETYDGYADVKQMLNDAIKEYDGYLSIINTFLMLLSCKNITTTKNPPDQRILRKRQRTGRVPLFTYHTLTIKQRTQNQSIPRDLWHNRVHLCRGHFKTFTEENPLLGKHVGRYWWQPIVRGRNKKGSVEKDYLVESHTNDLP